MTPDKLELRVDIAIDKIVNIISAKVPMPFDDEDDLRKALRELVDAAFIHIGLNDLSPAQGQAIFAKKDE